MTFSTDTRAGVLVAVGTALITVPFAIGLSAAAIVAGAAIGVVTVGLGFAGTATSGRGTLPLGAHMVYDRGLGLGLLASAALFALVGEPAAAAVFAVTGVVQLAVHAVTRYTATPAA